MVYIIVNFNAKAIRKSDLVDNEMTRLRSKLLQTVPPLQCPSCTSHVTIALLNVRSIVAKLPDVEADHDLRSANVLCFCETWLSSVQPSPVVNKEHVVLRCDRLLNDHKGGAMISVHNIIQVSGTVTFVSTGIECVVTMLCVSGKRLQVSVLYRSPTVPLRQFVQFLIKLLEHLSTFDVVSVVLGDMNDDRLCKSGSAVERFMMQHGYTQLVKHTTTDHGTLLDHVYVNMQHSGHVLIQVHDVYYSDHDIVYCSIPVEMIT